MPRKPNYLIAESDLSQLNAAEEIAEFQETYSIGGFDLNEDRYEWDWDSDNYGYDDYSY